MFPLLSSVYTNTTYSCAAVIFELTSSPSSTITFDTIYSIAQNNYTIFQIANASDSTFTLYPNIALTIGYGDLGSVHMADMTSIQFVGDEETVVVYSLFVSYIV